MSTFSILTKDLERNPELHARVLMQAAEHGTPVTFTNGPVTTITAGVQA